MDIRVLDTATARAHVSGLASVLADCVEGGASVGFMSTLSAGEARAFYEGVCEEVEAGNRLLLAAFVEGELVGTVQLLVATLPNAAHRGEIAKLLVRRSARGHGVARALMARAEGEARAAGKTLLFLDTATGSEAERLYESLGWTGVATVAGWALYPDGSPCETTFFVKRI